MSVSEIESIIGCRLSAQDRREIARRASRLGAGDRALSESHVSGTSAALLASALEYRDQIGTDGSELDLFADRLDREDERNRFARKTGLQIRKERRRQVA